jgi:hypothetical protein
MTMSNEALIQVVGPDGYVVTVKRHSLKKNADGALILKPGWKLHEPKPAAKK